MIFLLNQNMIWRGSEGGNVKDFDAFEVSHESTLMTEYKLQYKYMWNNKLPYTLAWPALYQYKCHALSVQYKCHPLCIHKHGTNTTFKKTSTLWILEGNETHFHKQERSETRQLNISLHTMSCIIVGSG